MYTVILEENMLPSALKMSPTQRIGLSYRTMVQYAQPGESRCGWRTTQVPLMVSLISRPPLKTSGMWSRGRLMVTSCKSYW